MGASDRFTLRGAPSDFVQNEGNGVLHRYHWRRTEGEGVGVLFCVWQGSFLPGVTPPFACPRLPFVPIASAGSTSCAVRPPMRFDWGFCAASLAACSYVVHVCMSTRRTLSLLLHYTPSCRGTRCSMPLVLCAVPSQAGTPRNCTHCRKSGAVL